MPIMRRYKRTCDKNATMASYECDKCDFTTDSTGELAAHTRWEHGNDGQKNKNDSKGSKIPEKPPISDIDVDNDDYMGVVGVLQIKDLKTPNARCSDCGNPVKPGHNCQNCGAQLNWSVA